MADIKIDAFSNPALQGGTETLPPPGAARREVLAERADNLAQQAETKYADVGTIPDKLLQPDREIQDHIAKSHLEIGTNPNSPYMTKWVNFVNVGGQMVWNAKSEGRNIGISGWKVANAEVFPEAHEMGLVREDGTIRVADTILMFMRKDEYFKLQEYYKQKRLRQQYGVEADIHEFAEGTNRKMGREVFRNVQTPEITGLSDSMQNRLETNARRHAATRVAGQHIGNRMKDGPIPGVPVK